MCANAILNHEADKGAMILTQARFCTELAYCSLGPYKPARELATVAMITEFKVQL